MTMLRKTINITAVGAFLAGTISATPAADWYDGYDNGAAVAGAIIGGMALGAAVGSLASQPGYGYSGGYGPGYGYEQGYGGGYGYGYAPYRTAPRGYGVGYGYGYRRHHHHHPWDYDD